MTTRGARKNVIAFHNVSGRFAGDLDTKRIDRHVARIPRKSISTARTVERMKVRLKASGEQPIATRILPDVIRNDVTNGFVIVAGDDNVTPILGYSELLITNKNLSSLKIDKYLQGIRKSVLNASSVVRGLREFYRKNSSNEFYENVFINNLIEEVVELTKHKWKNQAQSNNCYITITLNLSETKAIFANLSEIKEILTNLIFNAVDSIIEKGSINISTRNDNNYVVLEVSDTGHGMTEEIKQKIFEPFFTTKGNDGTGLGMSMVYGIIQRHNGIINIESSVGKGSCFSIYFPISLNDKLVKIKDTKKILTRKLHVLIIEDEKAIQEVLSGYLSFLNHTFEIANNGLKGLEKFQKGHFDLIITDYAMPEMNGRQMSEAIKLIAPNKPIILLTGFGDIIVSSNDTIDYIEYVLSKPVTIDSLENAINSLF